MFIEIKKRCIIICWKINEWIRINKKKITINGIIIIKNKKETKK